MLLTLGFLDNRLFSIPISLEFLYLNERAYSVVVYTPKKSRIGHCIFFLTDYIQSNFVSNISVPRYYLDFFDSRKI